MPKPEEYGVSVRLVQEGGADVFEARVAELPDLKIYGDTQPEAYSAAIEVIRTAQKIFAEKGKPFPDVEHLEDEFSGRVTLRMSKSLHRKVHQKASRDGVSLNHWIVEAIASKAEGEPNFVMPIVVNPDNGPHRENVFIKILDPGQVSCFIATGAVIDLLPRVETKRYQNRLDTPSSWTYKTVS